jgi:hypothetical protein
MKARGAAPSKAAHVRVKIVEHHNRVHHVYHREDYDRKGEYDLEASQAEWELEEAEEKIRMLEVRWAEFEKALPPGQKCQERLEFEAGEEGKRRAQAAAEERARLERMENMRKLQEARYT